MTKTKFEVGQPIQPHQDWVGSGDCFLCGKALKDVEVETRFAMTQDQTVSTLDAVNAQWFGTDYSPRVGSECVKRLPVESVLQQKTRTRYLTLNPSYVILELEGERSNK